jgi:F0F1-type ATP synthase gamma subunit
MLARPDGVQHAALELAAALWPDFLAGSCSRVALFYSRAPQGDAPDPVLVLVAPPLVVPQPPVRQPPLTQLPPETLVLGIIGELVVARLILAFIEALRAENTLRLRAMDRAKCNVENRLGDLRLAERRQLQEVTTSEILELVNGAV